MALLEAAALVERRLDRAVSTILGISFSEYRLLQALGTAHENSATRVDLAASVGLTPSAVTRALKPMEKIGYVTSQKSDRDARRSLATLTKAGLEQLANAQGIVDDVVSDLPVESLDLQVLTELQENLLARSAARRRR